MGNQLTFAETDVKFLEEFGKFLVDKARMSMLSIPEITHFHKLLVQYNVLTRKVEAHVMEVVAVHTDTEETK